MQKGSKVKYKQIHLMVTGTYSFLNREKKQKTLSPYIIIFEILIIDLTFTTNNKT